jgi:hypothetical protein
VSCHPPPRCGAAARPARGGLTPTASSRAPSTRRAPARHVRSSRREGLPFPSATLPAAAPRSRSHTARRGRAAGRGRASAWRGVEGKAFLVVARERGRLRPDRKEVPALAEGQHADASEVGRCEAGHDSQRALRGPPRRLARRGPVHRPENLMPPRTPSSPQSRVQRAAVAPAQHQYPVSSSQQVPRGWAGGRGRTITLLPAAPDARRDALRPG